MRVAVIIPAHDEVAILERNARRISSWGTEAYGDGFSLVLSENGSTDSTAWVARLMEKLLPGTTSLSSSVPGKGGAVKRGAASVEADVYLMMDADLSADFASAEALIDRVASGTDAAIGSRRIAGAVVDRPLVRRLTTAIYALAARLALDLRFRDLQCGCKAFSRRVRDEVLPDVRDEGFFFDTEFLARMARGGFAIAEVPVHWTDGDHSGRASKVRIVPISLAFLKKLFRLRLELR